MAESHSVSAHVHWAERYNGNVAGSEFRHLLSDLYSQDDQEGDPMFERCTERVRRVIFFAGYEASQFGSTTIEAEHLLLGLFREDKMLTNRFLRNASSVESIREEI